MCVRLYMDEKKHVGLRVIYVSRLFCVCKICTYLCVMSCVYM